MDPESRSNVSSALASAKVNAVPIILILLLALLIGQVGFWDALAAILGAAAMIALFAVLAVAAVLLGAYILLRRLRRRV